MKWISNFFPVVLVVFAPFQEVGANIKTQEKVASKVKNKTQVQPKIKALKLPPPVIPQEYRVYEHAKKDSGLLKLSLQQIESHQRELKKFTWNTSNKALEKEMEDLYWFYEIARAEKIGGQAALLAWTKALNSLHQFKWIYAWTKHTSNSLLKVCKSSKKPTIQEKCSYLAKKVVDAFPKLAVETQSLKELLSDNSNLETTPDKFERISQTYGEKTEKDEQAFTEVLDHYLNRKDGELIQSAQNFIANYPKSMLRFRAMFLMAERQFAQGDKKEAENNYSQIINQIPYSYYAIVSSERLGVVLKDRLIKDPFKNIEDTEAFKLNYLEKESYSRLQNLMRGKKYETIPIEIEQFSRTRVYPTEFLIHLIKQANIASQDLAGFRLATEILQRKNETPLNAEFLELIFPDRFPKEIAEQSKLLKIDPLLVVSLMKQESGFKDGILSSSGAAGLMQLMPFTAIEVQKDLELRQLREPSKNIEIGSKYLAMLLNEKFKGNVVYALAGYNAGPHRVAKWRKEAKPEWGMQEFVEAIPYKETRDYVMSILRNRYWYQYRKGVPQQSVFEAWRSP